MRNVAAKPDEIIGYALPACQSKWKESVDYYRESCRDSRRKSARPTHLPCSGYARENLAQVVHETCRRYPMSYIGVELKTAK